MNTYPQDYIDACRTRMKAQLDAYDAMAKATTAKPASSEALDAFSSLFFTNLVIVLDGYFMHRTRGIEGKDGNPLNEVRMLAHSMLNNDGVLAADKTIKYKADASVLAIEIGDEIQIDRQEFERLVDAYFAELEQRFTE